MKTQRIEGAPFHRDIMCFVERLEHDFKSGEMKVFIHEWSSNDQTGTIKLAKYVDKDVKRIKVYRGEPLDIVYMRQARGEWTSVDHRRTGV